MAVPPDEQSRYRARAERIMNMAAELVLRWGYKRVTIEDIAKRAGIGKGTVYLHWKTREDLFRAVLLRESAAILDDLLPGLRADPAEVLPHRLCRASFLATMRRPLVKAMVTGDIELLGKLVETDEGRAAQAEKIGFSMEYFHWLREQGLVRADADLNSQLYALSAAVFGCYAVDPLLPESLQLSLDAKADALARLIREAFETPDAQQHPALPGVSAKVVALYEQARDDMRKRTYGEINPEVQRRGGSS